MKKTWYYSLFARWRFPPVRAQINWGSQGFLIQRNTADDDGQRILHDGLPRLSSARQVRRGAASMPPRPSRSAATVLKTAKFERRGRDCSNSKPIRLQRATPVGLVPTP